MVLLLVSGACTRKQTGANGAAAVETEALTGVRMEVSEKLNSYGDIGLIKIGDEYFALVTDMANEPPLHLINVSTDTYLEGISRKGRGPGEFLQPNSLVISGEEFIISDPMNYQLTYVPFGVFEDEKLRNHTAFAVNPVKFAGLAMSVFPADADSYIAVGPIQTNENKRFTRVNVKEGTNSHFGEHEHFREDIPASTMQLSYREDGTYSGKRKKFATAKYFQDRIDIFDFDGKRESSYRGPEYYENIDFETKEGNYLMSDDKNIHAYVHLTSTENYIYGLYSGKKLNQKNRNLGDEVVVLDWEGNLVRRLSINRPAVRIAVDPDDELLLVEVFTEEETGLYKYEIKR